MKYRLLGKEGLLTFGPYPEVRLTEARDKRDDARRKLRENIDPSGARKKAKEAAEREKAEQAKPVPSMSLLAPGSSCRSPSWPLSMLTTSSPALSATSFRRN